MSDAFHSHLRDTMLGVSSDRVPLSREQIKRAPVTDSFVSPNHGDGGWHSTPGCERYTNEWEPLKDRVLLQIIPEKIPYSHVIRPESAPPLEPQRRGIVVKIGKGKRVLASGEEREISELKIGDEVIIGAHDDWASQDGRYVICQEMDVRVRIRRTN